MIKKQLLIESTIFCTSLYIIFLVSGFFLFNSLLDLFFRALFGTIAISSIIGLLNIIRCIYLTIKYYNDENYIHNLKKATAIIKFSTIPIYILNFLLFLLLTGAMMNPFLIVVSPIVAIIGVIFAISLLIVTSTYSISLIVSSLINNKISKKQAVLYGITQAIFIVDIIGVIVFNAKTKEL